MTLSALLVLKVAQHNARVVLMDFILMELTVVIHVLQENGQTLLTIIAILVMLLVKLVMEGTTKAV